MSTGGSQDFTIVLNLDRSAGQASGEQQIAMLAAIERAGDRLAKAMEAQAIRSGERIFAEHKKAEDRKAEASQAAALRAAQQTIAEHKRAEDKKTEASTAASRARADQEKADLARQDAAFMAHVDRTIAMHRRVAAEGKMAAKVQMEGYADFLDHFSEGFGGQVVSVLDSATGKGRSFADSLRSMATVGLALSPMLGVIRQIGQELAKGRQELAEHARMAKEAQDRQQDTAALQGKGAPTGLDLAEFNRRRTKTGMSADAAHGFQVAFESSIATANDQNMSEPERKKLAERAALFAARSNKPGDTQAISATGNLAGTLARFQQGATADQVVAQMDTITKIASQGDGSNAEQFDQLNKVLTYLVSPDGKGMAKNPQEAAALVAMMSSTRPVGESATGVQQLGRALRGFNRDREKGTAGITQAEFLRKAGVNENQTILESMDKVLPLIAQAEKQGRAPDAYLKQYFQNEEEVTALVGAYRATKQGSAGQIRAEASKPLDLANVQRKDKEFLDSPAAKAAMAQAKVESAQVQAGLSAQPYELLKQEARAALIEEGGLGTPMANAGNWLSNLGSGGAFMGVSSEEAAIDAKISEILAARGITVRDDTRATLNGGRSNWLVSGFESVFGESVDAMNLAGGSRQAAVNDAMGAGGLNRQSQAAEAMDWTSSDSTGGSGWGEEAVGLLVEINNNLKGMRGGPITAPQVGGGQPSRSW